MPDSQTSSIWTSSTCRLQPYSTQTSSTRTSSTQTSSTWTSSTPARERATDNFRQVLIQRSSHLLKRSLSFKLTDDLSNNCSLPPSKINQKSKSKTNETKPNKPKSIKFFFHSSFSLSSWGSFAILTMF